MRTALLVVVALALVSADPDLKWQGSYPIQHTDLVEISPHRASIDVRAIVSSIPHGDGEGEYSFHLPLTAAFGNVGDMPSQSVKGMVSIFSPDQTLVFSYPFTTPDSLVNAAGASTTVAVTAVLHGMPVCGNSLYYQILFVLDSENQLSEPDKENNVLRAELLFTKCDTTDTELRFVGPQRFGDNIVDRLPLPQSLIGLERDPNNPDKYLVPFKFGFHLVSLHAIDSASIDFNLVVGVDGQAQVSDVADEAWKSGSPLLPSGDEPTVIEGVLSLAPNCDSQYHVTVNLKAEGEIINAEFSNKKLDFHVSFTNCLSDLQFVDNPTFLVDDFTYSIPSTYAPGENTVSIRVGSLGEGDAPGSRRLSLQASIINLGKLTALPVAVTATFGGKTVLSGVSTPLLPVSSSWPLEPSYIDFVVPDCDSTYTLTIAANADQSIMELDYDNNVRSIDLEFRGCNGFLIFDSPLQIADHSIRVQDAQLATLQISLTGANVEQVGDVWRVPVLLRVKNMAEGTIVNPVAIAAVGGHASNTVNMVAQTPRHMNVGESFVAFTFLDVKNVKCGLTTQVNLQISSEQVVSFSWTFLHCDGSTDAPSSTSAPSETTRAPSTTAAPSDTTRAPSDTTRAPSDTTRAPSDTTRAPSDTTRAPSDTTRAPSDTTRAPSDTTRAPSDTTRAPSTTAAPSDTTRAPSDTTRAPSDTTRAPSDTTRAPSDTTRAPSDTTRAPSDTTRAPSTTAAPSDTTKAPEPTESPTTEAPAGSTAAPSTDAPTQEPGSTSAPTTAAPPTTIAPTEGPAPTNAPSTAAPSSTHAPSSTAAPDTTAAPSSTRAPSSTAAPTDSPSTSAPSTSAPTTRAPTTTAPPATTLPPQTRPTVPPEGLCTILTGSAASNSVYVETDDDVRCATLTFDYI